MLSDVLRCTRHVLSLFVDILSTFSGVIGMFADVLKLLSARTLVDGRECHSPGLCIRMPADLADLTKLIAEMLIRKDHGWYLRPRVRGVATVLIRRRMSARIYQYIFIY